MKVIITGGAGFIGSNFVRYFLNLEPDSNVIVYDLLTYAGSLDNLSDVQDKIHFVKCDICDIQALSKIFENTDVVFHFAAETHVDRSIYLPSSFIQTNVVGTYNLLEISKEKGVKLFVHISTDEIYGSIEKGYVREDSPLNPSSPYSASKASADLLAQSYFKTYGLPVIIIRPSNNFGPYQFPEKLIPLCITQLLEEKPVPIYGKGLQMRDWIYVEDCCSGIYEIYKKGRPGEVYNLGAGNIKTNIDVVKKIIEIMQKPHKYIVKVKDRPAHDFRYAMNTDKLRKLGWKPLVSFEEGIYKTVDWYLKNREWWEKRKTSQDFQIHKKKVYGKVLM